MTDVNCDPCENCLNFKVYPGGYDTPDDYECLAGEDWNENGTRVCPGFRPKFVSDTLYEQLDMEKQYIWYLEDEARVRDLTDDEKREIAHIKGITMDEVEKLIEEWRE